MRNQIVLLFTSIFLFSFILINPRILNYRVSDDFSMIIKGSSNVHDWTSSVEKISGDATVSFAEDGTFQIDACEVIIPVKSIKSTKGSMMDKKTWKALNMNDYPNIRFKLKDFGSFNETGSGFSAKTSGTLNIAGVDKTINMKIFGSQLPDGSIEVTGSKELKMTDFDISPPTALMGAMTTGNEITIEFRVVLKQ